MPLWHLAFEPRSRSPESEMPCRHRTVALCDAGHRARLGYLSCRCHSCLRRAHAPCWPSSLSCSATRPTGRRVAVVVHAVAMAVASTRAHTRLRSQPRARAPTHVLAFAREGVKPDPFIPLSLDRSRARRRSAAVSRARRRSAAVSRGFALRGTLPPGWRERRVDPELARPFLCLHARTVAGRGHPSRATEPFSISPLTPSRTHARARHPSPPLCF
jgi:hypothetical protein